VTEETASAVLPTATGFAAKCAMAGLRQHNTVAAPLLQRVGLSEHDLDNLQRRISAAAQSKFLEYAAEAMDDSAFGLHIAEKANPREAGLLFYAAASANNLNEALALFARYSRIVNETLRVKLAPALDGVIVEVEFVGIPRQVSRQLTEFGVAITVKAIREVAGRRVRPTHLSFVHGRNSDLKEFERFFACPVEFAAHRDQIGFSSETLAVPLITEDRHLLETLRPICDGAARECNIVAGTLRAAVENEVQKLLPHGKAERRNIAARLAMSARTLSRRLAGEGTTYEKIVDHLRRSLALQYIKEEGIQLSQIAWLLGYEGSPSFNHAFRRWTGRSPSEARNEKLLSAPI
jgi:AraC-like DNA-binding protein